METENLNKAKQILDSLNNKVDLFGVATLRDYYYSLSRYGRVTGDYKVASGGITVAFSIPSKLQKSEYFIKDIRQARKTLNVVNMRSTDIISLFKMPQESAFEIRGELKDIRTSNKFYKLLGLSKREITNLEKLYRLKLPPRQKRKKLSHRSKDSKKNS